MLLATSCKEDVTPGFTPATPGDEVVFAAKLNIDQTRTIYDGENADKTGLKINWTNKDYIAVASPQCMAGRQTGYYKVNIGDASSLNYAVSLDKQGETGVQWGNADKANFYAVYPAASANDIKVTGNSATANITVPSQQINFLPNNYSPSTDGATTSYVLNPDNNTMAGQFMYAQAKDQESGKPVELQFTPTATTLMITFKGFRPNEDLIPSSGVMIQNVTLTAPTGTNLAGSFNVKFNADAVTAPSITADNTKATSNSITATTLYQTADGNNGQYLSLKPGQSFSIKILLNPVLSENLKIGEGWTISIKTAENGTYTKALTAAETANTTLVAGKVHKMNLPLITVSGDAWKFEGNESSWMAQIPHNVYVTELSLPGAWYAWDGSHTGKGNFITGRYDTNEGYQKATATISELFKKGIRAFHVETRVGFTSTGSRLDNATVVMNGTGNNGTRYYQNATALTDMINNMQSVLSTSSDEYAVLAINYSDGGSKSLGDDCKSIWVNKLQSILSSYNNIVFANEITPNTTVGEVRGKIIVLICIDAEVENNATTWPNALFAYTDMKWESGSLNTSLISPMKWKAWPYSTGNTFGENVDITTVANNANSLYLNYTLANRSYNSTTETNLHNNLPSLLMRQNAISTIISNSDKIYATETHNTWYLIGAGGTTAQNTSGDSDTNGPSNVANSLNQYLLDQVNTKLNGNSPSPVGLVFINQATNDSYNGPALIKAIFDMNNKFYLNRAPEPTTQENAVRSASPNHASGFKVNSDSWTVF